MRRVRLALAVGFAAMASALAIVLSQAPLTVAGTDGVPAHPNVAVSHGDESGCQPGGTLPRGTTAIRVSLAANTGPRVRLAALSGSGVVTAGERGAGWGVAESVTVPVSRVPRTIRGVRICNTIGPAVGEVEANGSRVRGRTLLRIEYLRPGPKSWLSMVSSVARHMGIGHAPGGAWVAFAVTATMIATSVLASRVLLRELR